MKPKNPFAAVVIIHGSDPVKREMEFAKRLVKEGIAVLTYDKRGVGESGGVYVGPSVGTNNLDTTNLNLLSHGANAAVNTLRTYLKDNIMHGKNLDAFNTGYEALLKYNRIMIKFADCYLFSYVVT